MSFFGNFKFWGRNPLTIIELIIGISSIVGGLYVLSPFLAYSVSVNGAAPIVALLSHPISIYGYGLVYLFSGILIVFGIFKRRYRIRSAGLFVNILARIYGLCGTFIVQGLLPLTWISPLIVLLVTIICYVVVRGFIFRGLK
jgi:hypothetical protein